jgi:hypothetical protein
MTNYCVTVPILPGGVELIRKWNEENVVNNTDHDMVMRAAGISQLQVWVQHLPQGDFAVASYETNDPEKTVRVLSTSSEPWAVRFREHLKRAHGLDLVIGAPPLLNEMVVDWREKS